VISLGQLQDPRREFVEAANTGRTGHLPPPRPEDRDQSRSTGEHLTQAG
jgi:NADH dehydrogenase